MQKLSCLVADDSKVGRTLVSKMIVSLEMDVQSVKDGQEAIDAVNAKKFDIIFMDYSMPNVDGVTATKEIRKFNQSVIIVALTARGLEKDKKICLEAGMDFFLSKPVNVTDIKEAIELVQNLKSNN